MNQNTKNILKKTAYFASVAVVGTILGLSLQLVKAAWSEPSSSNVNTTNVGAPINTSGNWQTKAGGMGTSYNEIITTGEPTLNFHRPGLYATGIKLRSDNNLWFGGWSAGEGAAGIVAGNIWANSNLCLGGDCRNAWQKCHISIAEKCCGSNCASRAYCPGGTHVTGGGFEITDYQSGVFFASNSVPENETTWLVHSNGGQPGGNCLRARAVCCR